MAYVNHAVAGHGDDAARDDDLIRCIEALKSGDYLVSPCGEDRVSGALAGLIDALRNDADNALDQLVQMSIHANQCGMGNANMLAELRKVDGHSHTMAAAVEEMQVSIEEIGRYGSESADEVAAVREAARNGTNVAKNAVETIEGIAEAVGAAVSGVNDLSTASVRIGDIVRSIEEIAAQTNLLALNATIEAARAGEAGKGFAVVANEVKTLAQQTATATDEIRERIGGLRADMEGIVGAMKAVSETVDGGREAISLVGRETATVEERVDAVGTRIDQIADVLVQQTEACNEVTKSVVGVAEMTTGNVAKLETNVASVDESDTLITEWLSRLASCNLPNKIIRLAKADHVIWKKRLASMMAGLTRLTQDELADHRSCRLGKWYYGDGSAAFRHHPAFRALEEPHRRVHDHGREAARLFAVDNQAGAVAEIGKVEQASIDVLRLLDDLDKVDH